MNAVQAGSEQPASVGSLLEETAKSAKYETAKVQSGEISIATVAGGIIGVFLSVLGVIFVLLTLYGGYLWMNARGNQEQVTKAKDLITSAVIGLIIIIAAYAVTYFVLYMLAKNYFQSAVTGFN